MFVDLKVKEGADLPRVISSLDCRYLGTTGEAEVIGADIPDRNLVIESNEEIDTE